MSDTVALIVKRSQGQTIELVAQAGLGNTASGDGRQGNQAIYEKIQSGLACPSFNLCSLTVCLGGRGVVVEVPLVVVAVLRHPVLVVLDKGGDERVHLDGLPAEDLQDFAHPPAVLDHAKLDEEAGKAIFIVLLRGLGVVPRQLFKF